MAYFLFTKSASDFQRLFNICFSPCSAFEPNTAIIIVQTFETLPQTKCMITCIIETKMIIVLSGSQLSVIVP